MGFSKMLEILQEKEKGYIILANAGSFYLARGKDAILLNKLLDLKLNCMEKEICKVGFPIASLEKYTKLLKEKDYSFLVYQYDNKMGKLLVKEKYTGTYKNETKEERQNCYICKHSTQGYKTDIYVQAVAKLYETENKNTIRRGVIKRMDGKTENKLLLIPKTEKYIEYMLQVFLKLPRTEKYSIGTEYKSSLYSMLQDILWVQKIDRNIGQQMLIQLNQIDAKLNVQRMYLRIMKKNHWMDEKKFTIAMGEIYEIGKILGGLIKYYAKNHTKPI